MERRSQAMNLPPRQSSYRSSAVAFASESMQIGQQILDLLIVQLLTVSRHFGATKTDDFSYTIIICR